MRTYLVCCLLMLASCGTSPKPAKQTLHVSFPSDPATADPTKNGEQISSTLQFMLFEGLTRMTPESTRSPGMAEHISLSEDKRVYTFHLRNATWSDGTPVSARDFEYAWKLQLSPGYPSPNAHLFYPIKGAKEAKQGILPPENVAITALDDRVLQVELETPTPYFLELTSFCPFFPIPSHKAQTNPNWAFDQGDAFVCNGPFHLDLWASRNRLILSRNTSYWQADQVQLDAIEIAIIEDDVTALDLYEKGALDILGSPFNTIPLDASHALKEQLYTHPTAATTICPLNLKHPILQNTHIRKALSLAVNRSLIVENIMQQGEEVATGPVPPILKSGINHMFYEDGNEALAKALFAKGCSELGIDPKEVPPLTLSYQSSPYYSRVAQALQQQWKETLGLTVALKQTEFKLLHDALIKRQYDIGLFIWIAQYNDQMNILDRFSSPANPKNYPGWSNSEYTALLEKSMHADSESERISLLAEAETLFVDDMPLIPIFHWQTPYLIQPYFKGCYMSPIGSIHLENAYLKKTKK